MRCSLILPAGGGSSRFGGEENKLFVLLGGRPVFVHALAVFREFAEDGDIVIPVHPENRNRLRELLEEHLPWSGGIRIVDGGKDRTHSVMNALEALDGGVELTAVHDAARPLVTRETVRRVYEAAAVHGAAAAVRRITDTLKTLDDSGLLSNAAPNRDVMRAVETPQIFRHSLLLESTRLAVAEKVSMTDDTAVVERFGHVRAFPVESSGANPKITYREDLALAEALLSLRGKSLE